MPCSLTLLLAINTNPDAPPHPAATPIRIPTITATAAPPTVPPTAANLEAVAVAAPARKLL